MPMRLTPSNIEVPAPSDCTACGGYTGLNLLELQQVYRMEMEKLPAVRSQIARGSAQRPPARR